MKGLNEQTFVDLQNRFRGLVANFRSKTFVKERPYSPSSNFRSGLRDVLLEARVRLEPPQFDPYLAWINQQLATQLADLARSPVGYDELRGIFTEAPVTTLERELVWLAARINADAERLNAFRHAAENVEQRALAGSYEDAISTIQGIEHDFGTTLWSVQLRIALEQKAGGLERQKRYVAEVRSVYKRGLLGFVAYHTSVRNEDKTTLAKFVDDIRMRIDKHPYFDLLVKTYARYRLAQQWPNTEAGMAEVLRVEQSHSSIDIYETFIAAVQEILRSDHLKGARGVAARCLSRLTGIADFRIAKAAWLLGATSVPARVPRRNVEVSDALLGGNAKIAAAAFRRVVRSEDAADPWQWVYAGFALAHSTRPRTLPLREPKQIARMIGRIIGRTDFVEDSYAQLSKVTANFRGLPCVAGIFDVLPQLRPESPGDAWKPYLVGLNSPFFGIEDLPPVLSAGLATMVSAGTIPRGVTEAAWSCFHGSGGATQAKSYGIGAILSAAGLIHGKKYRDATNVLRREIVQSTIGPLRTIATSFLLQALFELGDRQSVIELVAENGSQGEANRRLTPIIATLERYSWADYKEVSSPLAVPIALHLLWTVDESEKTASLLRFATARFLRQSGAERASKLFDSVDRYPRNQLIYFLSRVCVPSVLDASRVLKSSKEVMEERQAICAILRLLDPANAAVYEVEVITISDQLALDEGQWIVDRTRIHVDEDALLRLAMRELFEDYERYRDLLSVDIRPVQTFDDVLKEVGATTPAQQSTFIPENESDAVLVSMLARLGEEFLNNPGFGFDFYLSKRIRHQSFIGLIRGPLEFANLITTRESESGGYRRNDFWVDKFLSIGAASREIINSAFSKCAARFDDTLIAAKDTSFHVRSEEHPAGLIYLEITPPLVALARAIVRMDVSLADFTSTVLVILWAALEPSLTRVRRTIAEEIKTKIAESFDELRATVRRVAESDPAFLEFDMEIGRRSTEVQRALDDAGRWFSRADVEVQRRRFTLTQVVKVAIDSALKCQRAFEPAIESVILGERQLTASGLVFVHDVLFVALDNVRVHSGVRKPKVSVRVDANADDDLITIEVLSEAKAQNIASKEKELADIRQLIDMGASTRRTRREGGSGLLKLAASVSQSSKGLIEFGFKASTQFCLKVTYSLVVAPLDHAEHDDA